MSEKNREKELEKLEEKANREMRAILQRSVEKTIEIMNRLEKEGKYHPALDGPRLPEVEEIDRACKQELQRLQDYYRKEIQKLRQ